MIPILFEKTETKFTSNGLGRLADCTRCIVTEERNGIFECEFDVPVSSAMFDAIQIGRIIGATHDDSRKLQPFDIYAKSEPINGLVTFRAHHISYRLGENAVKPFTATSCALALDGIKTNLIKPAPFTFWTDKAVQGAYNVDVPKNARSLLVGEEGSILDVFGTGEYEFDRFEVKLHLHRGQDTNASIRYGKNLVDFTNEYNAEETYTSVVPFWLGDVTSEPEEGSEAEPETQTVLVTLPGWTVNSGESVPSGREVLAPLDLSDAFEEPPTTAQLQSIAEGRLDSSKAWLPNQTMTVDFVQLWQTKEYENYAPLQRLNLCDTCGVFVPMYGISVRAKVVKTEYNTLLDRYDSMELGDKPTSYAAVIEKQYDSKVAGVEAGLRAIAVDIGTVQQAAAADATQKADAAEQAAISAASTDATNKANQAQANAEATAAADATAKADAAEQSAINTASEDATQKANAAEKNAKNYADSSISSLKTELETQIDAKIETWAQSTDPASNWTTSEVRTQHDGDLWLYTGTSDLTVGSVTIKPQGVYKYNGSDNTWSAYSSTSNNLFDLVDSKSTIFYGTTSGTYANKEVGDYLVDSSTGSTYRWSGSAWVKQTDYETYATDKANNAKDQAISSSNGYTDDQIASAKTTIEANYNQAIAEATDKIRGGTGGYVVTTVNANGQPIELLITDNLNLNQAVNVWRWNQGGLAHSSNGYNGPFSDVAITADGKINASMILTGILQDPNGNTKFNLTDGSLTITKGTINLGNGNFVVADTGKVTALSGDIAGFTLMRDSKDNRYLEASWLDNGNTYTLRLGAPSEDGSTTSPLTAPIALHYKLPSETTINNIFRVWRRGFMQFKTVETQNSDNSVGQGWIQMISNNKAPRIELISRLDSAQTGITIESASSKDTLRYELGVIHLNGEIRMQFPYGFPSVTSRPNLYLDGTVLKRTTWTGSSKHNKKDITRDISDATDPKRLYGAEVYQFKYKDDYIDSDDQRAGVDLVGFIIEQLEEVYPTAVDKDDPNDSKTWNWNSAYIIPPMLKLIQDQKKEIDEMRAELDELKAELNEVKDLIKAVKK